METIFVITDSSGRKIRLTEEQWKHIMQDHQEIAPYLEEMKETLSNPTTITTFHYDDKVKYYCRYFKSRQSAAKYLLIIAKYLNGDGFIITSYFVRTIQ